jgi:predicted Zn-dependent protease
MPSEGGFDHISFLLSADAQGVARAIDVLVLSLGETSSSTLRRALLPMLAMDEEHVVRRMQGTESAFARHGGEISKAQALATQGKPAEALAVLSALPTTLRNDPFVMAQRVTITRMSGDEQAYLAAIDELAARHPNDPVTVMNQLDAYAMRQRYTDALNVVRHIEQLVAPDPYLDVLRANLLTSANMAIDATAAAHAALTREPDLIEAHWALVAATLKQPDYAATTRALIAIHRQFGLTLQLEGVPDYAGYVASPAYAELKAALNK